ncbi:MAG: hypothetical protein ABWY20_20425 [Mycobacterium sp.]
MLAGSRRGRGDQPPALGVHIGGAEADGTRFLPGLGSGTMNGPRGKPSWAARRAGRSQQRTCESPTLLRKVKVVAARLDTPPLIDWVDGELVGY